MSTIEKLLIRGIRSFGVDNSEGIHFNSPLSLIVGQNGCGKTTIIECLKYALTGEMPPGSNKGQSFVHDPKMSNYNECIAQVKLQVRNVCGKKVTVTRSMKTSMKKSKLSFETMDSTICVEVDGKDVALSKRCVDVNTQMASEMGVSKAILNNVIFCHQEDSSWPLDEQKKLKEKFDAIFGTTEYNKALDKVVALRKGYTEKKTIAERDLREYLVYKGDSDRKGLELSDAESKLARLDMLSNEMLDEMKPIKEKLDDIRKIELDVSKWVEEKTKLKTKLENCRDTQKNLRSKIKHLEADKDVDDLELEIQSFKVEMKGKEKALQEKERGLNKRSSDEKRCQSRINELESKTGTLVYKRKTEKELKATRIKKVEKLCVEMSVEIDGEKTDDVVMEIILNDIQSAFMLEENKIQEMAKKHDRIDEEFQNKIDESRDKITVIETDIQSKREQIARLKREEQKLEREITEIEQSAKKLAQLNEHLDQVEIEQKRFQKDTDLESMQKGLDEKRQSKSTLETQMERLDEEIRFLTSISHLTTTLDMKTLQLDDKECEVKRLKAKHSGKLKSILRDKPMIEKNYRRTILSCEDELKSEKQALADALKTKQMRFAADQSNRKTRYDNLKKFNAELTGLEERIYDVCGSTPYDDLLLKLKESLEKTQMEFGALKSSDALYKKYIDDLKDRADCPLCHAKMSERDQLNLSNELLEEISLLPNNIKKMEKVLAKDRQAYEKVLELGPSVQRVERLRADICEEDLKVKGLDDSLKVVQAELEDLEEQMRDPAEKLELISTLIGDMQLLDDSMINVEKLRAEIKALNAKMPDRQSEKSLDDVQLEKTTLLAEVKGLRAEIDAEEKELNSQRKHFNDLCEKRNQLKNQQLTLQEGIQALSQLKERMKEVQAQANTLNVAAKGSESQLEPMKRDLMRVSREKQSKKEENRQMLEKKRKEYSRLNDMHTDIQNDTQQLDQFAAENLEKALAKLEDELSEAQDQLLLTQTEIQEMSRKVEELRKEISDQAMLERDLQDNLELKRVHNDEQVLLGKYDNLRKTIEDADYRRVDREKKDLLKRQDEITAKRGEIIGQQSELKVQVKRIRGEMNEPRFKDAAKNYQTTYYEVEVLKRVINDLATYKTALEWALLKFHAEHMDRINEMIREFWRDIYRGNDIDYIQIRTDEQTGGDKRRSYNYRVVQCKNGTEIDMRGRCSAGQRVLASIIIRMALAETFSSNCGVLALDEPTTNLDKENIESLCMALRKIIDARKSQTNFMLLVITHDEDFVQSLGNIDVFYKVSRDPNGKSVIRKWRNSDNN